MHNCSSRFDMLNSFNTEHGLHWTLDVGAAMIGQQKQGLLLHVEALATAS